jgi:hypothetical protein
MMSSRTPASLDRGETTPMGTANMSFLLDRLGQDCHPLQYLRELTQNSIQAIQRLTDPRGEVIWDVDWNVHTLTNRYKLCVIDAGIGMTGDEMVKYINQLSSSIHVQTVEGNYGVGAKVAAAPRNRAGLIYLSWKEGIGYTIHLWKDPTTGQYGLRRLQQPDGTLNEWAYVEDAVKPDAIREHGTMVILLGNEDDDDTMTPPEGTPTPSQWIARYLNTRYFAFPDGVTVKARQGWQFPRSNTDANVLRSVTGQRSYLDAHASAHGTVPLTGAKAHWWILRDEGALTQNSGFIASSGHAAALYQGELYEMLTGRAGVARLQAFGVIFGHNRVVIYLEPLVNGRVVPNTARTQLLLDGGSLPWEECAAEFRDPERMPQPIKDLIEEVAGGSVSSDHRQSIRERLRQVRDLFRISRYRPAPRGKLALDDESLVGGVASAQRETEPRSKGGGAGGRGSRAGDIYALFITARGTPGEEFILDREPNVRWVSVEEGTRTPPDLEDRAAKFLVQENLLLINGDFRVFADMVKRWCDRYAHVPGAQPVVSDVVREWFEQQLIEAVLGTLALRGSQLWTLEHLQQLWSEEALTAVVLPRYHIENNVKRTLGAKLGTLKDRVA